MKRGRQVLQLAALASSVLLIGVFIAYRAGAFDDVIGRIADSPPSEPDALIYGSKSAPIINDVPKGESTTLDPMFLGTSKSIVLPKQPQISGSPQSGADPKPPVFIGGTKSEEMIKPLQGKPDTPAPRSPEKPQ